MPRVDILDEISYQAVSRVTLFGEEVKHVTMADSDRGIIECYKTNEEGRIVHIDGHLCKTELNGLVEIFFKPGWSQATNGNYVRTYASVQHTFHNPLAHKLKANENADNT